MHVILLNLVVLAAVGISLLDAYCLTAPHSRITEKGELVCEFDGYELLVGESRLLEEKCLSCTCSAHGLSCCAKGKNAGVVRFEIPDDCERINCKCNAKLVKRADHTIGCFSGRVIPLCKQEFEENALFDSGSGET